MLVTHTQTHTHTHTHKHTHTVARPSVRIRSYISFNRSRRIAMKWNSNERTRAFTEELTGRIIEHRKASTHDRNDENRARNVDAKTIDRSIDARALRRRSRKFFLDSKSIGFASLWIIRVARGSTNDFGSSALFYVVLISDEREN